MTALIEIERWPLFRDDEKQPSSNDLLIISVRTEASTSPICLTSHVGAASAEHCLFSAARSKAITSWDVTTSNRPSCGTLLWFIVVAGACRAGAVVVIRVEVLGRLVTPRTHIYYELLVFEQNMVQSIYKNHK